MGKLYDKLPKEDKYLVDLTIAVNSHPQNIINFRDRNRGRLFIQGISGESIDPEILDNFRESLSNPDTVESLKANRESTMEDAKDLDIDLDNPLGILGQMPWHDEHLQRPKTFVERVQDKKNGKHTPESRSC